MKISRFLTFLLILVLSATLHGCKKYYVAQDTDKDITNNSSGSESDYDYVWDASKIIPIVLTGNSATVDNNYATVESSKVTINVGATYSVTGSLTDGQIIVKTTDTTTVRLILSGVNVACSSSAPVYIKSAKKVVIILGDNSQNTLTDGKTYVLNSDEEPCGAIFSKTYLSFYGTGSLTVNANYKDGINGKDGVVLKSGTFNIKAVDDGIRGKDYLVIRDGNLTINAGGDALKSDNDTDTGFGYVIIDKGNFVLTSVNDAVHSVSNVTVNGGKFTISTSGNVSLVASGSGNDLSCSEGIKSKGNLTVNNADITIKTTGTGGKGVSADGNFTFTGIALNITTTGAGGTYKNTSGTTDSYDATCIRSDGNIKLTGGTITISASGTAGRGISCGANLIIGDTDNSPVISITTAGTKISMSGSGTNATYAEAKAIRSTGTVTINNGNITISSADDGIKSKKSISISNATVSITKSIEGMESPAITVNSGNISIVSSDDGFNATNSTVAGGTESNDGSMLTINGGFVVVNSTAGDPIDSNGNATFTGGTIIAHGPQSSPEVGIDVNGTINVMGGLLAVSGTNSNMTEGPSTSSSQYSILAMSISSIAASTIFHVQDASGKDLLTFKPVRSYYSMVFSSSSLTSGSTYYIYTGGTSTGAYSNGLYTGGIYSGGTLKKSFTISGKLTSISF
jgi:trimeric autotransporter adhesin